MLSPKGDLMSSLTYLFTLWSICSSHPLSTLTSVCPLHSLWSKPTGPCVWIQWTFDTGTNKVQGMQRCVWLACQVLIISIDVWDLTVKCLWSAGFGGRHVFPCDFTVCYMELLKAMFKRGPHLSRAKGGSTWPLGRIFFIKDKQYVHIFNYAFSFPTMPLVRFSQSFY